MTAQILYFPSNGLAYKPEPDEIPITHRQAQEIRKQADWVSKRFGGDGRNQLITKHIFNKIRVIFCVQVIEDIPRSHFNEVLNLIEQVDLEILEFSHTIEEFKKLFAEKILRNNDPWTPAVQVKWFKKLAKELPERPDWKALSIEIEHYECDSYFTKQLDKLKSKSEAKS
jgi:hypothetical protein